ncbi:MAG TPA: DUF3179 domain-containing (seleno)protein, partial [Chitinophagaceae bacterium]|nr:DUF3179 domain-containing (seleno)protein [Chitinophagaceae bacterium]
IAFAYWVHSSIGWIRSLALIIMGIVLIRVFKDGRRWEKIALSLALLTYATVFIVFNYRLPADAIFQLPVNKSFIPAATAPDKNKLVIAVVIKGEAKAYPLQLIGYHHQVLDTVGGQPLLVTYCTVCRTGRVFSTLVAGRPETFRLVGMDHFNAVFEDASTRSWWQQATGEAIAGPRKGMQLQEIPSTQLTVEACLRQYPNATVMAPDPLFDERYFRLEDYDRGKMQSSLVKRDYRSWQEKSWIVGVKDGNTAVAYDWNELVAHRLLQDSLDAKALLLVLENDTTSFHVYDRKLKGATLQFAKQEGSNVFTDLLTKSVWNMDGRCIEGALKGEQLATVQSYHQFWHSWQTFQPNARKFSLK